jgi:hypothetical protein
MLQDALSFDVVSQPRKDWAMEEQIRELAYLKWEAAGYPQSNGVEFWLQAEESLTADSPKTSARPSKSNQPITKVAAKASVKRK